jgi:phosphoglycolate phosphatase-like HAD superfamily hydrolase
MNISLVVFDLDGTLISSHETIYKSTVDALKKVGVNNEMDQKQFNKMIGWHFEDIFDVYGFKVPDFENFIRIYKSVYFNYIDSSYLYEGVKYILDYLQKKNIVTGLLTTKAQDQADLLVEYFGIKNNINYVMGRRPGLAHKPSPEPLIKICNDLGVDVSSTMIVGDTEMDIECGRSAGAKTCAVCYGYRTVEELKALSPDFIIDNIAGLEYIVAEM